jgi:hypothetical protein
MTVAEVNEAIDRWADFTITDKTRKHSLELAGSTSRSRSSTRVEGDVQCGVFVIKILECRCVMLCLHAPQIIDEVRPKQTAPIGSARPTQLKRCSFTSHVDRSGLPLRRQIAA